MTNKRYRSFKAKPGEIRCQYGKPPDDQPDICYAWGDGTERQDSRLISHVFRRPLEWEGAPMGWSFLDELKARGYDLTTIKFSISKTTCKHDN